MTRTAVAVAPVAANRGTPGKSSSLLLQRKCACGGSAGFSGKCEDCTKNGPGVQRRAAGPATGLAPPIVHEVLRSPGQPLDPVTRAYMEPRFGHDFGSVRVHANREAAQSAQAVNAFAYTVGRDVVFASGRYAPDTSEGRKLLTHELVHTLQQPTSVAAGPLRVDAADSPLERAADRIAGRAMADRAMASPASGGSGMVQRQSAPEQHEQAETPASTEGEPKNQAGEKLTDDEHTTIKARKTMGLPAATPLATAMATTFVLHDSGKEPKKESVETYLTNVALAERGPLGKGVNAYVPREGDPKMVRSLFTPQRPGAVMSEQELQCFAGPDEKNQKDFDPTSQKNIDPAKWNEWRKQRDALLREVWNGATEKDQNAALDNVLPMTGEGKLSEEDKYDQIHGTGSFAEKQKATQTSKNPQQQKETQNPKKPQQQEDPKEKKEADDFTTGARPQLSAGGKQPVKTTGLWAVENLCNLGVSTATNACDKLKPYFAQRNARVDSTVHVEMLQQEEDEDIPKFKDENAPTRPPAYTAEQYENVVGLYLRTADIAGKFPKITTHFFLDGLLHGHYDPRCFDLDRLYGEIAATIGHPTGCTYGVKPSYGTESGKNNIWWTESACHCKPPGAGQ